MTPSIYTIPKAMQPWTLEELLPTWDIRYFSFARRALARGLAVSGIGEGDAVLLPSFICRDLLSGIHAVGAKPVYYEVSNTFVPSAPPSAWPAAKGVIAVNYFGFSQDLTPFRAYASTRGAILIEDNAHGLFSRDSDGTFLGTRGDLGLFSLRKSLTLGTGAALASPIDAKRELGPQDPFASVATESSLKAAFRSLSKSLGPRLTLAMLEIFRTLKESPASNPEDERVLPLPVEPDPALAEPLTVSDEKSERHRRRSCYLTSAALLKNAGFEAAIPELPNPTVPYAFPFRCKPQNAADADRALAGAGLRTLPWPDLPDATAAVAPAHYKDIRLVHFLW